MRYLSQVVSHTPPCVFVLQYAVAVTGSLHLQGHETAEIVGHAVSGATAGYFAGWAVVVVRR